VPGALSNVPGGGGRGLQKDGATLSRKENEVINYEINKIVKSVVEPYGQIKKLSVAVLVDGTYTPAGAGADGEPAKKKYTPRSEEDLAKIASMVKASVGFDEERGDTISVVNIPFAEDLPVAESEMASAPETSVMTRMMPLAVKYGSVGLSVIFLVVFVLRPIIKRLTMERTALETIDKTLPAMLEEGEKRETRGALEAGQKLVDETENLKRLVRENPRQAAMVLKTWMQER
jgi:flagellar M-ring protein FliF